MNIYLISQNEVTGYDVFDAAVVAAKTPKQARHFHPLGAVWAEAEKQWIYLKEQDPHRVCHSQTWAKTPQSISVRKLGIADKNIEAGVILASFNAG